MAIEVGSIIEGKVSGIMPFGAFVALPENKVGLVHISEVASSYVTDVSQYLTVGDTVKVKVIKVDEKGKISLSIKKAAENKPQKKDKRPPKSNAVVRPADIDWSSKNDEGLSFEDKLNKFKQDSDEKMLALKRSNDSKRSGGYRRGGGSF